MNIFPQPKSLTEQAGAFCFGSRVVMHVNCSLSERRKTLLRSLWNRFSLTGSTLEIAENSLLPAFCARIGQAELPALEAADEYAAVVTPAGIGLAAKDETGLLHAFYSLIQAIDPIDLDYGSEALEIPCLTIHDHPSMDMRSIHVCVFPETTLTLLEKCFTMAGLLKCSHIVLEFWGTIQYDALPEMAWSGRSYSKRQIKPLIELANDFGMEVVPMTNHLGHASQARGGMGKHAVLDQNPRLATLFEPDGWTWCLSNPRVHTLLRRFREELIELCGEGKYFHLGCDEAYSYASCRRCAGKDRVEMLARYLNGLAAELDEQGRRAFIWGDQFLETEAWKGTGYIATSRPDQMTHLALEKLDRRLIIADWQYSLTEEEKIRSAELFREKGFDVVLCPWDGGGAKNTVCLAKAVDRQHLSGLMVTTWHHLPTMMMHFPDHLSAAWNGADYTPDPHVPFTSSVLIRKLMPKPSRFEDSGFYSWEVDSTYTVNP